MVRMFLCAGGPAWALFLFLFLGTGPVQAQPVSGEESVVYLERLNVKDADLRDVLRGIGQRYNLNLVVDNRIEQSVTLQLSDVPVMDAVRFLCDEYDLQLIQKGAFWRIVPPTRPPPPPPPPLNISFEDSLLSIDVKNEDLEQVLRAVQDVGGTNLVVRQSVKGTISGLLKQVPLEDGLRALLSSNGFTLREKEGIYYVDRAGIVGTDTGERAGTSWVQVDSGLVSLDVVDVPIVQVIRELGTQVEGTNIVTYAVPEGKITARVNRITLEATLDLLLKGSDTTYRKTDSVYSIGLKQTNGIAQSRLIRLDHVRPETAFELLPEALKEDANVQAVKEHNGLVVTGSHDAIQEVESFIHEIDHPTPLITIEALVVDFLTTDVFELGLTFGRDPEAAEAARRGRYSFGTGDGQTEGFQVNLDGRRINEESQRNGSLPNLLGIQKIGRLPSDFFVNLQALDRDGHVNIRSRPQITTINGHKANISIGTTQYYLLNNRTTTPFQQGGQIPFLSESQRFERIEANDKLEITPWVSASGDITAEIRPEFSAPVGDFNPEVPPTINSRILEATVRLRDGETIMLGGLIRDFEEVNYNKVPLLGSIPLLGHLFRSEKREVRKAELVIFITPHVFYGDGLDREKWESLRQELDLRSDHSQTFGHTTLKQ